MQVHYYNVGNTSKNIILWKSWNCLNFIIPTLFLTSVNRLKKQPLIYHIGTYWRTNRGSYVKMVFQNILIMFLLRFVLQRSSVFWNSWSNHCRLSTEIISNSLYRNSTPLKSLVKLYTNWIISAVYIAYAYSI